MPHHNPGYDIRSETDGGRTIRIEVKGRIRGAPDVTITRNEVLTGKNLGDDYRLALVDVSPDGPHDDQVRYVMHPFGPTPSDDFRVCRFTYDWTPMWAAGGPPR
jgi:hypothetical protein